jgi:hypothetical protein
MRVKSWNCTGIASRIKSPPFRNWLSDADIVGLQETFLTSSALQISGFTPFVKPARYPPSGKKHRALGGLVTLVSSQLGSSFRTSEVQCLNFDGFENQCVRFDRCDENREDLPSVFFVLNCYVVSQPTPFDFSGLFFALDAYLAALDAPVVILGDFNAHWRFSDVGRVPNARDREFRDFVLHMGDTGFSFFPSTSQDLRYPTFISSKSSTVIDYFFVRGVAASGFGRRGLTVFGHQALHLDLSWPSAPLTELRPRTSYRKHFRSPPPASFFTSIRETGSLSSHWDFIRAGITQVYALFVLCCGQLFQVCKPSVPSESEPWHRYLSEHELAPLLRLENNVFSLVAGAQLGEVPLGLAELNSQLRQLRRTLHSLATRRLFDEVRGSYSDPTKLWAFVRRFRVQQDQGVLPIDVLVSHFTAVFNRQSDPVPMVFCSNFFAPSDVVLDGLFTLSELEVAVNALDRGTAPGVSGIGNDVLKELFRLPGGPGFFLDMFNACMESGVIPDPWRCTEIFLLFKGKGELTDPGSYRGIALMESTLKLYERLLFARLSVWAASRGLIPDSQFGFRPRSSTLDAVFVFVTLVTKYVLIQGSQLFTCLVDFQKAFPSVNRAQLLFKLESFGVSSRFRRCINSLFVGNTFSIRSGSMVTREFPVTTGLREGSVLSPLLFVLFMSDVGASVLRPFGHGEFLKRDPSLNCIPIPGLLYADDLVLFCLSADLLRERLRRLCDYADKNTLTVNVSKCEIVVFGGRQGNSPLTFKYKGQAIPIRRSCKYLGVWIDGDLSGRSLADAISHKFKAAVPVFFGLCRRLRLSRLDLVYRLSESLVFSLLYGGEFLRRVDVIDGCEDAWWSGIRAFYGLPSGVSRATLRLIFPRMALRDRVLRAKYNLMYRGSQPHSTLFPEAFICDRGFLFTTHRRGFSQNFKDWCDFRGFSSLFNAPNPSVVRAELEESRTVVRGEDWAQFSTMKSTSYAASIFQSASAFYSIVFEASKLSRLGVRAMLLSVTGTLSLSYCRSRCCVLCGAKFTFEHLLSCANLGPCVAPSLSAFIQAKDWCGASRIILSRFQVFVHAIRGGELSLEESELFDALVREELEEVGLPLLELS